MSSGNFLAKLLGRSIETDLEKAEGKNPLDVIVQNPIIKNLAKSYRKEIAEGLEGGERALIALIESFPLLEGETQAAPIIDIDYNASGQKEIRLIVAAFSDTTLTRTLTDIPLRQFLTDWFNQKLK